MQRILQATRRRLGGGSKAWWRGLALLGVMATVMALTAANYAHDVRLAIQAVPPLQINDVESWRDCHGASGFEAALPVVHSADLHAHWVPTDLTRASGAGPEGFDKGLVPSQDRYATCLTWFRFKVPAAPAVTAPLWIYSSHLFSGGPVAIYVDGTAVYQAQAHGMTWDAVYHPLWTPLLPDGQQAPHEVLLRLSSYQLTYAKLAPLWIGTDDALSWRPRLRTLLTDGIPGQFAAAFFFVGLYLFFVWCRQPRQTILFLYFFLATMGFFAFTIENHFSMVIANDLYGWFRGNFPIWWFATTHYMLLTLHRQRRPWLDRCLSVFIVVGAVGILPAVGELSFMPLVNPLDFLLPVVMGWLVLGFAFYDGMRKSRLVVVLSLIDAILLINSIMSLFGASADDINLNGYLYVSKFLMISFIMYRQYAKAMRKKMAARADLKRILVRRELELKQSYDKLREIERQGILTRERERLMQDMHDGLGSSLHGALRAVQRGQINNAGVSELLQDCIDDLRLTIDSMEPVQTDLPLLLATLRFRLGRRFEAQGIELRWDVRAVQALPWLDQRCSLHVMRILQETFTNVIKHTRADTITVSTVNLADAVAVRISDNGGGFDLASATLRGGRGLANQRRRAQSIGADISWDREADGTCVTLKLPLEGFAAERRRQDHDLDRASAPPAQAIPAP